MESPRYRLLFVDDEARILRALKALFRGHDVWICDQPEHAAELAKQHDVDVIICDQRMPGREGVEVLRECRQSAPRAMRILLTGYSDLKAVLGSVNDGEVFRFVNKPWDNTELRSTVEQAGRISRDAPVILPQSSSENDRAQARAEVGVLVIEDDVLVQRRLREILSPHYQVRFAATADRALQIMEQHEVGVVISETDAGQGSMGSLLKALKHYHPEIATVVITERANAQVAIDLINEGQVYRMLLKPVRMGSCRLSVDSALGRYWALKQNPQAAQRFVVAPGSLERAERKVNPGLLARLRSIPSRLLGVTRFS